MKKELPLPESTTLIFIHWLVKDRGLKAGTINNYLAGIRQLHIAKGLPSPNIRTATVNLILRGLQNKEASNNLRTAEQTRQPITEATMLLLKKRLGDWEQRKTDQRLIWAVATNLFHGLFRVQELLCEKATEFDPAFTLLTSNIHWEPHDLPKSLQFQLKAPKEDRKCRSTIVDVYSNDSPTCPVRAFTKWVQNIKHWPANQPAFRWSDGSPLTASQFNKILKERLEGLSDSQRAFTSHCFRIGAASRLGALGHSDEDVKAMGRWSSRAFEEYMLHPRTKRAAIAKQAKLT